LQGVFVGMNIHRLSFFVNLFSHLNIPNSPTRRNPL